MPRGRDGRAGRAGGAALRLAAMTGERPDAQAWLRMLATPRAVAAAYAVAVLSLAAQVAAWWANTSPYVGASESRSAWVIYLAPMLLGASPLVTANSSAVVALAVALGLEVARRLSRPGERSHLALVGVALAAVFTLLAAAPFVMVILFRSELDALFESTDSFRPAMDWVTLAGIGEGLACPLIGWLFWRIWRTQVPVLLLPEPVGSGLEQAASAGQSRPRVDSVPAAAPEPARPDASGAEPVQELAPRPVPPVPPAPPGPAAAYRPPGAEVTDESLFRPPQRRS